MYKFLIAPLILLLVGFTSEKLKKVKLNENVTVYIPESFTPMTQQDIEQRYESYRLPLALYTDPERLIDFGVNRSFSRWQEKDIEMMGEFYEASLLELYDKVTFLDKGVKEVKGHSFAYFEFQSVVNPETKFQDSIRKYSYLMYGIAEGTTYLFNFTCPASMQDEWRPTAQQMMASIKLR